MMRVLTDILGDVEIGDVRELHAGNLTRGITTLIEQD